MVVRLEELSPLRRQRNAYPFPEHLVLLPNLIAHYDARLREWAMRVGLGSLGI